jgi:hypothetical protein
MASGLMNTHCSMNAKTPLLSSLCCVQSGPVASATQKDLSGHRN